MGLILAGCSDDVECDFTSDIISQVDGSNPIAISDIENREKLAQRFTVPKGVNLAAVRLSVRKVGEPAGTLRVSIHDEDNDRPDNDSINDGGPRDMDVSSVGTSFFDEVRVDFPGEPEINGGTDYYIVIESTEAIDPVNFFELGAVSDGSAYGGGELYAFDGDDSIDDEDDAWSPSPNQDLEFTVEKCEDKDGDE